MKKQKFNANDVIIRTSCKNYKTPSLQDKIIIVSYDDDLELYLVKNTWDGVLHYGLKSIIEGSFEKV